MARMDKKTHRRHGERGSALVMVIILSVAITGMVLVLAWECGVQGQVARGYTRVDTANFAAEAGAAHAVWVWKNNGFSWPASAGYNPLTGTISEGGVSYSYTVTATPSGTDVAISSTATSASSSAVGSASLLLSRSINIPAIASSGSSGNPTITLAGNTTINGNFTAPSKLTVSGAGVAINGTLKSGNTITYSSGASASEVTGGATANASGLGLSFSATSVYTTFAAGSKVTISTTATTLDFTSSPNGVLYVSNNFDLGKVTTIKGTGTLVVNGDVNLTTNQVGTPSSPLNINIVAKMDFNPDVNFYIKGSIYNGAHFDFTHYSPTGLNWSITGSVVTDQNILFTAGNTGTLTTAPPPSFDPRWATAGSGVTVGSYHTALP